MKIAASASYKAVPSMLIVAPTGSTNLVMRLSTPLFSSKHLNVIGKVAELKPKGGKWRKINSSEKAGNIDMDDGYTHYY